MSLFSLFKRKSQSKHTSPIPHLAYSITFAALITPHLTQAADFDFDNYSCTPFDQIAELNGSEQRTMTFVYHRVRSDSNSDGKIDHNDALTGDGYLVENVHSNGHLKVYNLSGLNSHSGSPLNITASAEFGGAQGDFFMGGHHNYTGMGAVMAWNKSGFSQVDLNDIPNWPTKGEDIRLESYIDDLGTFRPDKPAMAFDRSYQNNYGLAQGASPLSAWCNDGANKPTEPWVECDINIWYPLGVRRTPMPYGYKTMNNIVLHDMRFPNTYDASGNLTVEGNPELSTINVLADNDFEGGVNIIGNLLFVRGFNETGHGVAVYDISDPSSPAKLDSLRTRPDGNAIAKSYNMTTQWENFMVIAMNQDTGFTKEIDIIDFDDPSNLQHVYHKDLTADHNSNGFGGTWGWSTRYPQFKDDHMYVGNAKVDMTPLRTNGDPALVGTFSQGGNGYGAWGSDLLPIGNILVTGGQSPAGGARVYCNEANPDTAGPTVAWHWPKNDGASNVNMHVNSRIGVLIHEQLDWNTVNDSNFQIRDSGGNPIPVYVSWNDNQTINVTPQQALDLNTTYEFYMPANGVKDIAGNGLAADYSFNFSTGASLIQNSAPSIDSFSLSPAEVNAGTNVTITSSASDADGDTLSYTIDWGDGTTSSASSASHAYSTPGIYSASISVSDGQFQDSRTVKVLVKDPTALTHSTSSSIIFDTDRIVNVNPDNDTITAFDTSGNLLFKTNVGKDPRGLAVTPSGDYWVTNYDDATISIISSNGNPGDTINLKKGSQPFAILMNSTHAFVSAEAEGVVYKIGLSSPYTQTKLSVGPRPYAMAMNSAKDTLLVTRFVSPESHGELYKVNISGTTFSLSNTIQINEITGQIELQTFSNGVPNYLTSVTFSPDGTKALIGSKKDNVRRGTLGTTGGTNAENTVRSMISIVDLTTNTDLDAMIDVDNRAMPSSLTFAHGGQVLYVSHRGNNDLTAYDANLVLNSFSLQQLHRIDTTRGPISIAVAPNNDVYMHNFLDRVVSKTNLFTGSDNSLDQFDTPIAWNTVEIADEKLCPSFDCTILEGKQLFYSASDSRISLDGYLSCAGCHDNGGSDERVWDFTDRGEGLRNTISLKGRAGIGHGNVHWSANFDEIQDFENDIRGNFGGTGLMSDSDWANTSSTLGAAKAGLSADLDALAAYVTSLNEHEFSPYRNDDGTLNDSVSADLDGNGSLDSGNGVIGKTIFEDKNCASCHKGEDFTDSNLGNLHDVGTITSNSGNRLGGTLTGIDTPTLRGLWESAPYLHDGSADSIVKVLENTAHVGSLTNNERNDLAAYLLQIDSEELSAPSNVVDDDGDGVENVNDDCPYTPPGSTVDADGCAGGGTALFSSTFDSDMDGFTVHAPNGSVSQSNGEARATISNVDGNDWKVQIYRTVNIVSGQEYTICFDAKADNTKSLTYNINRDASGYERLTNGDQYASLTTSMARYTHTFTANVSDTSSRFEFNFANDNVSVNIDYVAVYEGSACDSADIVDADHDGVYDDGSDQCLGTPFGAAVDSNGCSTSDSDGDGVADSVDQCANTPTGTPVDSVGCPDADSDGVIDSNDNCANTPNGESVNANGCSDSQLDDDNDSVMNNADNCANTPNGESVDSNGCSSSQLDDDNDGVMNNADNCASTPNGESVDNNGCSSSQLDDDNDGVMNNADNCANTPSGEAVDANGCSSSQGQSECNSSNSTSAVSPMSVSAGDCISYNVGSGNLQLGTWNGAVVVSITNGPQDQNIPDQAFTQVNTGTGMVYIKIESGASSALQFGAW